MPRFIIHVARNLELDADDFQHARDRAIGIVSDGDEPELEETDDWEIVVITDEKGNEWP